MEELDIFAQLSLDEAADDDQQTVVGRGEVGAHTREVTITNDEISYEKASLHRWPAAVAEKEILGRRFNKTFTWKEFFIKMDTVIQARFAGRQVVEYSRRFGTKSKLHAPGTKRRQQMNELGDLGFEYSITAVACNSEYAVVLVHNGPANTASSSSGRIWVLSTITYETSNWLPTDSGVTHFQAGCLVGDVLYVVCKSTVFVYKLPRGTLVYQYNVWERDRVLLEDNVNVIRATPFLFAVVTRSRGFLVYRVHEKAFHRLHYGNPNTESGAAYQYTTISLDHDMMALGRTDGLVEMWKLDSAPQPSLRRLGCRDLFEPVSSSKSGKLITPTRGQPIHCLELSGPKLAVSTEKDLVMINESPSNRTLCKLVDVGTPASIRLFGDLIVIMTRDGGLSVDEFSSGLVLCHTTASAKDATEDCVIGQQWVFASGDVVGGLWPNGVINCLSQTRVGRSK